MTSQNPLRILHLEDDAADAELIRATLASEGLSCDISRVQEREDFLAALEHDEFGLILADYNLPSFDGISALEIAHEKCPDTPFVFVSGALGEELAIECLKSGAADYVFKNNLKRLTPVVNRAIRESEEHKELKRQQQELIKSERRFETVLEITNEGVRDWNIKTGEVYYSPQWVISLGYSPDEVPPHVSFWEGLVHPDDMPVVKEKLRDHFEGRTPMYECENRLLTKAGTWRLNLDQGRVIERDEDGNPLRMLGKDTDITQKKTQDAQILQTQRLESIGTLAGGIAHDLNNMLTPIIVSLQLLRNKFKDDKSLKWIDTIEASARRGAGLIQQILVFSKGAGGDKVLLQASYLLSETNKILQDTLSKSIEVDIGIPKGLWNIMGEPTQLQQVLMNLCVNARDAMPAGGRLRVSAENLYIDPNYAQIHIDAQPGPYVVITVSDTGTGIAPEIMDRMFEPFFTTKDPGQGTGLGLSTAYRIIKDHEGFITVRSERGVGTEFKLYLPAIETTETTEAIRDYETDTPLGNGELVLVVDDEAAVRDITKLTLEAFGYRAITADDGAEAVGVYAQNKDDIKAIILDMMMPIMDGSATIRALKKVDPDVKIIAVSGLIDTKAILTSDNLTVDAFLNKPYTAGTLLKTLYEVVRFTNKPPESGRRDSNPRP